MGLIKIRGQKQMQEWTGIIKHDPVTYGEESPQVIKNYTLQYDPSVSINEANDLVTKDYVDSNLN